MSGCQYLDMSESVYFRVSSFIIANVATSFSTVNSFQILRTNQYFEIASGEGITLAG